MSVARRADERAEVDPRRDGASISVDLRADGGLTGCNTVSQKRRDNCPPPIKKQDATARIIGWLIFHKVYAEFSDRFRACEQVVIFFTTIAQL